MLQYNIDIRFGRSLIDGDFSYLDKFPNISFVIAINPIIWDFEPEKPRSNTNYTMQFPSNSNQQFYKRLKRTYRSTYGILKFVKHMSTSKQIMYQFGKTTK